LATDNNGWELAPLCKVEECELPAQVYSKVSINSKNGVQYLQTCCCHTYKNLKSVIILGK
jgi:hypothetical protein